MIKIDNNLRKNSQSFGALNNLGGKAVKFFHKADDITSVGQRVLIGATALGLQPLIDFNNKKVDKKTRQSSAARSIARAIIGTATGVAVRGATIKFADRFVKEGKILDFKMSEEQIAKMTASGKKVVTSLADASKDQIKNYSATIGTLIGLAVMIFTNFAIDVPAINWMQNKIMDKVNSGKQNKGVNNVPSK